MIPPWSDLVRSALAEDVGRGDLTVNALIPTKMEAEARLVAKEDLVVCGMPVMNEVFRTVDARLRIYPEMSDGSGARAGNTLCIIRGPARGILTGERVALNFFQNLCGVATLTRQYVEAVTGLDVKIVDTRKTIPGMRMLQKYAVRVGGGYNHRLGLDDGVLVKENHIALSEAGLTGAIRLLREHLNHLHRIEVECESFAQVQEALDAGAHVLLLDNMDLETLRRSVDLAKGKALLEASGGITLENVRQVAETGVDMISVGALTHSSGAKDVSLRIDTH
jgi:nicotinate-nucleotide pyrophosphorylase (carboxylating)